MQSKNVPTIGPRYWTAILVASVFGANMGDFASHVLHLGHYRGLAPLALLFGLIILAERRLKLGTEAYYWLAIVTLRTAATNLGDLATHDFKLSYPWVLSGLAVLLIGILVTESRLPARGPARPSDLPTTTGFYWAAMLTAGTLGTAGGDFVADDLGLGLLNGSIVLCGLLAVMLTLRSRPEGETHASYWLTIVAVRTAGTTLGDFVASRHGLGLGLEIATPLTGLLLLAILLLWRREPRQEDDMTLELAEDEAS